MAAVSTASGPDLRVDAFRRGSMRTAIYVPTGVRAIPAGYQVLVFDYEDRQFKLLKLNGSTERSKIWMAIKDKNYDVVLNGATVDPDAKVAFYIANMNFTKHKAKVSVEEFKAAESEKLPDVLAQALGDGAVPKVAGASDQTGGDAPKEESQIDKYFKEKLELFTNNANPEAELKSWESYLVGLVKAVAPLKDSVNAVSEATGSDTYSSAEAILSKTNLDAGSAKSVKYTATLFNKILAHIRGKFPSPFAVRVIKSLEADHAKMAELAESYANALKVQEDFKDSGNLFVKSFLQADPTAFGANAELLKVSIDEKLTESLTFQQKDESFHLAVSGGVSILNPNNKAFGIDGTSRIVERPTSNKTSFFTTAFVHALWDQRGDSEFGLSFGVSQQNDTLSYFLGPTWSYGRKQKLFLTAGLAWTPGTRLKDGFGVGDVFAGTEAPTVSVLTQSLFFAFSYRF